MVQKIRAFLNTSRVYTEGNEVVSGAKETVDAAEEL